MNASSFSGGTLIHDPSVAALWQKLRQLSFDSGAGPRTFAARLASEQGWSPEFTDLAIEEYRRFLLLFALAQGRLAGAQPISGDQPAVRIVPSAVVDKVWHLHLLYTRSYWDALCRDLLAAPLHHVPADGSGGETALLDGVYRETLEAYLQTFGALAPESVWPLPKTNPLSSPQPVTASLPSVTSVPASPPTSSSKTSWILLTALAGAYLLLLGAIEGFSGMMVVHVMFGGLLVAGILLVVHTMTTSGTGPGGSVIPRKRRRRGTGILSGESDLGGWTWGGSDSSSDSTHAQQGNAYTGSHDAGGHSHSCGGHSCGGHSCGGHGCGGH